MSCRVLGREVEALLLQEIVRVAANEGATKLVGKFIPTTKNELVRDHYKKLGFANSGQDGDATVWTLKVTDFQAKELPLQVERSGVFEAAPAEGIRQYA
jgi:predicted enzyme involved in methoxymalonyl-ACP biosynthesis